MSRASRSVIALASIAALGAACGGAAAPAPRPPRFFPGPPNTPRIQFLASYRLRSDIAGKAGGFRKFLLGDDADEEDYELGKLYGTAIFRDQIFACDTFRRVVWIIDPRHKSLEVLGGAAPGRLARPVNIAIASDGTRYVTDIKHRRVMVYDASNAYVTAFGDPAAWRPVGIALWRERLYVVDIDNGQVVVLDRSSGKELQRFASKGSGPAQLFHATNITIRGDGTVYVADTNNFRIQKFTADGEYLGQIGSVGRTAGHFVRPKGVAVDRKGRLYVVDAAFENVQVFAPNEGVLLAFGHPGPDPGDLHLPTQVTLDYDHVHLYDDKIAPGYQVEYLILVSSQYGLNKLNVYGFLRQPDEDTLPPPPKPPTPDDASEEGRREQLEPDTGF